MINRIKQLEQKLYQCNEELNQLIIESNSCEDKELMIYKINTLKRQAYEIDQQLNMIKNKVNKTKFTKSVENNYSAKPAQQINTAKPIEDHSAKPINKPAINREQIEKQITEQNVEKLVGKNLMNILASILIFVSIVSFASIILPALGDAAKIFLMFLVSFIFTGAGLFLQKKDKTNKFYLAITSCGFGAIYISLILSHVYFNIISQYVLYILILAWIIILNMINCEHKIFQIIAQIGICFSTFLGVVDFNSHDIITQYFLVIYVLTTEIVLLLKDIKKDYHENIINNIFAAATIFIMSIGIQEQMVPSLFAVVGIILIVSYNILTIKEDKKMLPWIIWTHILSFVTLISPYKTSGLIYLILISVLLFTFSIKFKDEDKGSIIGILEATILITFPIALSLFYYLNTRSDIVTILPINPPFINYLLGYIAEYAIFPAVIVFCIYLGFIKDRYWYKIATPVILLTWISVQSEILVYIIAFAVIVLLAYLLSKNYNQVIKIILYFTSCIILLSIVTNTFELIELEYSMSELYSYIIMAIYNIVFIKTNLIKDWNTKENETLSNGVGRVLNIIYMCVGLGMYDYINESIVNFIILTFLCIIIFSINSVELLKKEKIEFGLYVGFKYTVLMWVAVNSINAETYIISILCFVFAIACILYGFNKEFKNIRTYGLLLSIFSVIKLLLFDITYNDTLLKTLSFFICGILCFAISMIYNKIDKKQQE